MAKSSTRAGCVTGRLQPIHLDHLRLLLHALENHERLIVAITNPDPTSWIGHPDHESRHLAVNNPFTFYERQAMVRVALEAERIDLSRVEVVPFPLHDANVVHHYVPIDAIHYVGVYSPWEAEKVKMLRGYGYEVRTLEGDVATRISSSDIRHSLRTGTPWRHVMPESAADLIEDALKTSSLADRTSR